MPGRPLRDSATGDAGRSPAGIEAEPEDAMTDEDPAPPHPPRRGLDAGVQARPRVRRQRQATEARCLRGRAGRFRQQPRRHGGPRGGRRDPPGIRGNPLGDVDAVEGWVREICNDSVKPALDADILKRELEGSEGRLVPVAAHRRRAQPVRAQEPGRLLPQDRQQQARDGPRRSLPDCSRSAARAGSSASTNPPCPAPPRPTSTTRSRGVSCKETSPTNLRLPRPKTPPKRPKTRCASSASSPTTRMGGRG